MKRDPVSEEEKKDDKYLEGEEEDEEKACASKKSQDLSEDDLVKAIGKLEEFSTAEDPNARKNALLSKALEEDLDKSEQEELTNLISGGNVEEVADESISKGLEENETIQKALDVSDYLTEQNTELTKALGAIENTMKKSDTAQHEFNLVLARAVTSVGKMAKSINSKLDAISEQPVQKPRSTAKPLEKSFAGGDGPATKTQLSKGEILNKLTAIVEDRISKGMDTRSDFGVDLATETAKFEMTGQLHPKVLAMVNDTVH